MNKNIYLTRSNDDVVNWNEDELDEEANESHHHESDGGTNSNLREFCKRKRRIRIFNISEGGKKGKKKTKI